MVMHVNCLETMRIHGNVTIFRFTTSLESNVTRDKPGSAHRHGVTILRRTDGHLCETIIIFDAVL